MVLLESNNQNKALISNPSNILQILDYKTSVNKAIKPKYPCNASYDVREK